MTARESKARRKAGAVLTVWECALCKPPCPARFIGPKESEQMTIGSLLEAAGLRGPLPAKVRITVERIDEKEKKAKLPGGGEG